MTDDANIVPFGKYRGRPIDEMMADASYCAWAMSQPGLRERYASLFTIIINGGVAPDMPTPEHNRMQLLFRNPDMRLATFRSLVGEAKFDQDVKEGATNQARGEVIGLAIPAGDAAAVAVLDEEVAAGRFKPKEPFKRSGFHRREVGDLDNPWRWPEPLKDLFHGWAQNEPWGCGYDYSTAMTDGQRAESDARRRAAEAYRASAEQRADTKARSAAAIKLKQMLEAGEGRRLAGAAQLQILERIRQCKVEFEFHGWDVFLAGGSYDLPSLALELKPQIGDDYPAILRTMKKRKSGYYEPDQWWRVLIIDRFEAEGASLDDVKWTFEQSGIVVRTLAEVRAAMIIPLD